MHQASSTAVSVVTLGDFKKLYAQHCLDSRYKGFAARRLDIEKMFEAVVTSMAIHYRIDDRRKVRDMHNEIPLTETAVALYRKMEEML
jgi:hypothetical protein